MLKRESRAPDITPCGIETEFGLRRVDENLRDQSHWDFFCELKRGLPNAHSLEWDATERIEYGAPEDSREHPFFHDARWRGESNIFLANGARLYVDYGPHLEHSSPTCFDPKMLLIWNRAGYRWIDDFRKEIYARTGKQYIIFRNNVARNAEYGNPRNVPEREAARTTFGSHLNIAAARFIPEEELVIKCSPFFILLMPITGQGKVRSDSDRDPADFQISQRADWLVDLLGLQSTSYRGIYNLRDNPYADRKRFRRVHIICFDSNMLELPEYLKVGLCDILFKMIHDNRLDNRFDMIDPVKTLHALSRDTGLTGKIKFAGKKKSASAVECLREYHGLFWDYLETHHPDNSVLKDVLIRFDRVLEKLEKRDWEGLYGDLDWVTKKRLIEAALQRKGKTWQDDLAYMLDYKYSDNNHDDGLFYGKIYPKSERVIQPEEETLVEYAMREPPPTRSAWLKKISERYREFAVASDYWCTIDFELPERSPSRFRLKFPNPYLFWNEGLARELLSLPLREFIQKITEAKIAQVEEMSDREEKRFGSALPTHLERNWSAEGLSITQIVKEAIAREEFSRAHHRWWVKEEG